MSLTSSLVGPPVPAALRLLSLATGGGWDQAVAGAPAGTKAPRPPVRYGAGRGLLLNAEEAQRELDAGRIAPVELGGASHLWVITRGPGGLRRSCGIPGVEVPSLHCTSWTNLLLGAWFGEPSWHHGGNMPPLNDLAERVGPWVFQVPGGGKITLPGYGDRLRRIHGNGSSARRHGAARNTRYLDPLELWERRAELGMLTVSAQSTLPGKWGHHTVAWLRIPGHDDRLYRCAADGYKSAGRYSGTLMDVEVLDESAARSLAKMQLHEVWTTHHTPIAGYPVTLET